MTKATQDFQVFAKPIGAVCNLGCRYCYYLEKEALYPNRASYAMPDAVLDTYIQQVIAASTDTEIRFSWHGGEPTLLGVDYFKKIVSRQKQHNTENRVIINNIQTNGTLIDEKWGAFLAEEKFTIGLSMDGPAQFHDAFRVTKGGGATHKKVMQAWELLNQYHITTDILCVVNVKNVHHPLEIYQFFKDINARYLGFLPIVNRDKNSNSGVSEHTVPATAFGEFLCAIFDEWKAHDIGNILVQMFEEVARTALGQDHSLCIFRPACGNFPVVEHNGDFYACDHFVTPEYMRGNIGQTDLVHMLESPEQRTFGQSKRTLLPKVCRKCEVLNLCNGGCLKDRFIPSGDGKTDLNYLCDGYKLFFKHCLPFVTALKQEHRRQTLAQKGVQPTTRKNVKIGRNDPCPCGSGEKYKKCCMKKGRTK